MVTASISDLKTKPASIIAQAADYPVAIQNRGKTKAYLVDKEIFDKMVAYLEDEVDAKAVRETDFSKGRDFEEVARELGL